MRTTGSMSQRRKDEAQKAYAWCVITALVLLVVWIVALNYVPTSWPMLVVHGVGYMLSIVIMAGGYEQLKRTARPFHAFLIAATTWAIIFGLLRAGLMALFTAT